jgi:hypothetical protein
MPQHGDKIKEIKGGAGEFKETVKEETEELGEEFVEDKIEAGKDIVEKRKKDREILEEK